MPQQHHRLPPAAAQAGAPPPGVPPQSAARLAEAFDIIKNELETAHQEAAAWKAQRDEYENQSRSMLLCGEAGMTDITVGQQINELTAIRKALYDLEAAHNKRGQE